MRASSLVAIGVGVGVLGTVGGHAGFEAWEKRESCCARPHAGGAQASTCPAHEEDGKLVVTDKDETNRLRLAMRDAVFRPWLMDLGRAPTPDEIGERLHLDPPAVDTLMDKLEACGESVEFGLLRAPASDLIAVAWPLANMPTGITVTVEGGKPAFARCAIDALGVSKMMGKPAIVEAEMRDGGGKVRIAVNGDTLVSAEPADAIVYKGGSCDRMLFFGSQAGLDKWSAQHRVGGGKVFALREAVTHGAEIFGRFTEGLPVD